MIVLSLMKDGSVVSSVFFSQTVNSTKENSIKSLKPSVVSVDPSNKFVSDYRGWSLKD